jgi:hypothetical protein
VLVEKIVDWEVKLHVLVDSEKVLMRPLARS